MRRLVCFLTFVLTLVLLMTTPTRRLAAQASAVIDDPEAYAVYASVLPARFSSADNDLTHVALLEETRARMDCLPEPSEAWTSVVESYRAANASARRLLPGFNLGVSYTFISSTELSVLLTKSPSTFSTGFPNGKLLSLSAVGFNEAKTRALVTVQYECGFDCGGGWHVLREKNGGRWVAPKADTATCTWIT